MPVQLRPDLRVAVAGALAVGSGYVLGERLFGRREGIVAAALLLVNPLHLAYSQEGRPYALAGLFCVWSLAALYLALRDGRAAWRAAWAVATIGLLYTHYWGVFVVAGEMAALVSSPTLRARLRALIPAFATVAVSCLPQLIALLGVRPAPGAPGSEWIVPRDPAELLWVAGAFGGRYFQMASSTFSLPLAVAITGGGVIVLGMVLMLLGSRGREEGMAVRWILVVLGVTLLLPYVISFWMSKLFLWYRYPVILLPALLMAFGAITVRYRLLGSIVAAVLLSVSLAGAIGYFSWSKSNAREVAEYAGETAARDDVRFIIRPKTAAFLLDYYDHGTVRRLDETYLDQPLGEIVDTAAAFVYVSLDVPNPIRDYMDGHFVKVEERRFPGEAHLGMVVGLYRQRPDPDDEQEEEEE